MGKEIVKKQSQELEVKTPQTLTMNDVRKYFCPSATDKEIVIFLQIAKLQNLNPFLREIYLVKYGNSPASILTGYESYLKRAEESGKYGGFKVWTEGEGPEMKACIEVYRKDWDKPLYHEVKYREYVQKTRDGRINSMWASKPETMLKKVAISQGMRLAFPLETGRLPYIQEEIDTRKIESSKPEVEMPEEKSAEQPKSKQPEEAEIMEEQPKTKPQKNEPDEYYRKVTPEEGKALLMLAKENGWTKDDVKHYIEANLNYQKWTDLVVADYHTCLSVFSRPKAEVEKEKKEIEKLWEESGK